MAQSLAHSKWMCKYRIDLLLSIPPKYSVSQIMGYLKGKSAMMIFERHANFKVQVWESAFLGRGVLRKYGRAQYCNNPEIHSRAGKADQTMDNLKTKEHSDPFTGSK